MRMSAIVILLITIVTPLARGEELRADTPRGKADTFLERVGKGEISAAYDDLFAGSPIVTDKLQAVEAIKRQTESALPLYGKSLGFELQNEKAFGQSLVRLTYIQRLQKHPLVWRFWFYRPADRWYLDNVLFNDQFGFIQGD